MAEGLGCKAIRVHKPEEIEPAIDAGAGDGWREYSVPVVVEIILERVTNIAMGTEIDNDQRVRGARRKEGRRADCRRAARLTRPGSPKTRDVQPLTDHQE